MRVQLNDQENKIYDLTQVIDRFKRENERLRIKVEDVRRETLNDPQIRKLESEKSRNDFLEKELERLRNDNHNIRKKLNDVVESKNSSVVNNYLSSREIKTTQNSLSNMKTQISSLQSENFKLKSALNTNSKCNNHLHQIDHLKKINSEQNFQINNLKNQINSLTITLNNSQKDSNAYKALEQAYRENCDQNIRYIELIKDLKEQLSKQKKIQIINSTKTYKSIFNN